MFECWSPSVEQHLDFPAVLWLEKYLRELPSTLVVVSHDRVFINNVVTDIVHMVFAIFEEWPS